MNNNNINTILKYVKLLCPKVRKPKHTPRYYLKNIFTMMNDFVTWSALKNSRNCKNNFKYHYKSIARIHHKWCRLGVYKSAYDEIILNNDDLYVSDDIAIDLFVDSTLIINKCGIEGVGYGSETRKKRFTKLTAVCNKSTQIVAICPNETISKERKDYVKIEKPKKDELNINKINNYLNNIFSNDDVSDNGIPDDYVSDNDTSDCDVSDNDISDNYVSDSDMSDNDMSDDNVPDSDVIDNDISCNDLINNEVSINVTSKYIKKSKQKNIKKPYNNPIYTHKNIKTEKVQLIDNSKNKKVKIIKTLEHDIKGIKPIVKMIGIKNKSINLAGDKGYLMTDIDKTELKRLNVNMIAPKRKNQKTKNTDSELKCLKERYKIENLFAKIKVFNRVHVRRDKLLCTYMGFVYLACIKVSQK